MRRPLAVALVLFVLAAPAHAVTRPFSCFDDLDCLGPGQTACTPEGFCAYVTLTSTPCQSAADCGPEQVCRDNPAVVSGYSCADLGDLVTITSCVSDADCPDACMSCNTFGQCEPLRCPGGSCSASPGGPPAGGPLAASFLVLGLAAAGYLARRRQRSR
jgi:MYXO-CTERM domain-containing protein